jgi:regulator of PEP synthase PpsR (kinase-PPPase family)
MSIFRRGGFSVIKVTNKPIESVANEIIEILTLHYNEQSRKKGDRL